MSDDHQVPQPQASSASLGAQIEHAKEISVSVSNDEKSERVPSEVSSSVKGEEGACVVPQAQQPVQDDWDHAPQNPWNWSPGRKWATIGIVSMLTFFVSLASTAIAPALPQIGEHYHITNATVLALVLSIFLLSLALAPLFLAPFSEIYGRTWCYNVSNLFFLAFNIGCAYSPNTGSLLAFRFLAGCAGCIPVAIGGASVSDCFSPRDRGSAMSVYLLGALFGPIMGPVCGGWIAQTVGFKYIFVMTYVAVGVESILCLIFLRETYHPTLRLRLAKERGNAEEAGVVLPKDAADKIWVSLTRPLVMLTQSFICFIVSLYSAIMYGIYYLMFTTFPGVFIGHYGFDTGTSGLAYIGVGMGFVLASFIVAIVADKMYRSISLRLNNGQGKPEYRLPTLMIGAILIPIGLMWYGWSVEAHVHWIMPIIGTGIFGCGVIFTYLPSQLFLVDTFTFAASAVSASSVLRSLFGFCFPLFASQMYAKMGYGGGNSFLAGIALIIGFTYPPFLWFYGERLRKRSKLAR